MGVRSLLRYIYSHHSDCVESVSISSLSGCYLAVDGNNLMHYITDKIEEKLPWFVKEGLEEKVLLATTCNSIVHNLSPLLSNKVKLIVVMDGKIPELKLNHSIAKNGNNLSDDNVVYQNSTDGDTPNSFAVMPARPSIELSRVRTSPNLELKEADHYHCHHTKVKRKRKTRIRKGCNGHWNSDATKSQPDCSTGALCCSSNSTSVSTSFVKGTYCIHYDKGLDCTSENKWTQSKHNLSSPVSNHSSRSRVKLNNHFDRGKTRQWSANSLISCDYEDGVFVKSPCHKERKTFGYYLNAMERKSFFVDIILMMEIPVIRAQGEAEFTCSALLKDGIVHGILSRDTDHLVIGCQKLFVSIKPNHLESLNVDKLLGKLGITHSQFVDFCILCGTDYNMPDSGTSKRFHTPERALDIIRVHRTIDCAMEFMQLDFTM